MHALYSDNPCHAPCRIDMWCLRMGKPGRAASSWLPWGQGPGCSEASQGASARLAPNLHVQSESCLQRFPDPQHDVHTAAAAATASWLPRDRELPITSLHAGLGPCTRVLGLTSDLRGLSTCTRRLAAWCKAALAMMDLARDLAARSSIGTEPMPSSVPGVVDERISCAGAG